MNPVLIVGSSNTDLVAFVDRLPKEGETVMGKMLLRFAGGKGANQAVAAVRAGAPVSFAGAVGTDDFGRSAVEGFEKDGLDLRYLKRVKSTASGTALIAVDAQGRNQIVVVPGANGCFLPEDIDKIRFSEFKIAVFQLEIPHEAVWLGLRKAKDAGCCTILNPAPASNLPEEIFSFIDYLIPNQHELELIAGCSGPLEGQAAVVRNLGVKNLVVTLGEDGACCFSNEGSITVPAPVVKVIDTVGAGDGFVGVFAAALSRGLVATEALRYAVAGASVSVRRPGAQASYAYWDEICRAAENV